jgi:hypothetical protein
MEGNQEMASHVIFGDLPRLSIRVNENAIQEVRGSASFLI